MEDYLPSLLFDCNMMSPSQCHVGYVLLHRWNCALYWLFPNSMLNTLVPVHHSKTLCSLQVPTVLVMSVRPSHDHRQ